MRNLRFARLRVHPEGGAVGVRLAEEHAVVLGGRRRLARVPVEVEGDSDPTVDDADQSGVRTAPKCEPLRSES
jgi:hypothetical protein